MAGEIFLPELNSYLIHGRLYEPEMGRYINRFYNTNLVANFSPEYNFVLSIKKNIDYS